MSQVVSQTQQSGFDDWIGERASHADQCLCTLLPEERAPPSALHKAMRWASIGAGKRIRACMVYAAGHACHPSPDNSLQVALDKAAAAVELVHAYSLIHDDLPCMDDDAMRRGKPATHIEFGEAMALLAGDAMQPLAFEWLSDMPIAPALVVQATKNLAQAIGSQGMAGGQAIDLQSTGVVLDESDLAAMHSKKTGSLLSASAQLGAIIVGAGSAQRESLRAYSKAIGLAFQVVDDVLDATAPSNQLGKTAGKDAAAHKATYVSLLGVDRASELALQLHQQATEAIKGFGVRGEYLRGLADYIVRRAY
jgi:farnesyl diphosphate synthase